MKSPATFYRHILIESWHLSRKHLFLWPLAFFTSFLGFAGTFQIFFDLSGKDSFSLTNWYSQTDLISSIFIGWSQSFDQIPWAQIRFTDLPFVLFFFVLLCLVLALAIIITSSEGGLLYALAQLQAGKKTSYLGSFRRGLDKFWSLFAINLIYRLLYLVTITVIILPILYLVLQSPTAIRLMLAAAVYLVLIPLIVILDLVTRYSLLYIMVYDNGIREAFRNGWMLFTTNWITSIETAILIMATIFIAFLVLSLALIPLLTVLLALFATLVSVSTGALQIFAATALIILIAVVALFVTLFTALQASIWVGVFRKLTTGQHASKIHRLLSHLPWIHRPVF